MLNSPSITELTVESAPLALLNEWLSLWFDGGSHAVGLQAPVVFPNAGLRFGQSPGAQPLGDLVEIRVVLLPRQEAALNNNNVLYTGRLVSAVVTFNFWVSAKKRGRGQADLLAQRAAELLHGILANPDARYDLAERGITALAPQPPQSPMSYEVAERLVACGATLQYPVEFAGTGALVTPPATVEFRRESVLIPGEYLVGSYLWDVDVTLRGAQCVGWASQGQDTVLGLEVNGELTGDTLTLTQGDPITEVQDRANLSVVVPAGQSVRWRIVSGPSDPAATAWHVSLSMQTDVQ